MMWKFDHDQTNSHIIINKTFGVEECWSYIRRPYTNRVILSTNQTARMDTKEILQHILQIYGKKWDEISVIVMSC